MKSNLIRDKDYKIWLADIKEKVCRAQIKASVKVNTELLTLYWELGSDIIAKQSYVQWGAGFLSQLSKDLMIAFPDIKGFSLSNLKYIRQWYLFYNKDNSLISQQPVGQLAKSKKNQQPVDLIKQIPWGHNIAIIAKCKNIQEALYYVQNTIVHNWSRSVLVHQIESNLYKREGMSSNNFTLTLPHPQSDLAKQTLKDPYVFDFLNMTKEHNERDLENALINHVARFLLELGSGFAYIGRQIPILVGKREFFIDLLFYHTKLRCYIVIELKVVDFEPEHAGKLNFYLKAVDSKLRAEADNHTIGILICKNKDKVVVEYALSEIHRPIGVSEYKLTHTLPNKLKSSLPAIKQIETELSDVKVTKKITD